MVEGTVRSGSTVGCCIKLNCCRPSLANCRTYRTQMNKDLEERKALHCRNVCRSAIVASTQEPKTFLLPISLSSSSHLPPFLPPTLPPPFLPPSFLPPSFLPPSFPPSLLSSLPHLNTRMCAVCLEYKKGLWEWRSERGNS